MHKHFHKHLLGLWGLVNNAGIGDMRGWDDWQTPAIYERFWQVNTLGVIRATHAFKPLIKRVKYVLFSKHGFPHGQSLEAAS